MANEDNVNLNIVLDEKFKKVLEKFNDTTEKLTNVLEKPNKHDSDKELQAAELRDKTEKFRTANVDRENENLEIYRRLTSQQLEAARLNRIEVKFKKDMLLQEKRMKDKMRLEETRHFNEMIQRMTSGTLVGKMMGVGLMGGSAGVSGVKGLLGAGKKLAGKSAIGRAFMLESEMMSDAENQEAIGGLPIGFGDQKAKERTEKVRGGLSENKLGQGIVNAMKKSKIFSDKMQGGMEKYGKGLAIGGIGALGIGGSIITKAIESSPIAQSMMKIMSTAFTLILRPIGDFFGGVMKPIALRLLKFGAENVGAGANLFKMGEKVGIAALALFTDPAAVIGMLAERVGGSIAIEMRALADPFFNKTEAYAKLLDSFDEKMETIAGVTGGMEQMVSQASQQIISGIESTNSTFIDGIKVITDKADEAAKKLEEDKNRKSGIFGGYSSKEEQQSELERLMAESKANNPEAWANAEAGTTGSRGGQGMSEDKMASWLEGTERVKEVLKTIETGLSAESVGIIAEFEAMKEAGILGNTVQTELRAQFAKADKEGIALYTDKVAREEAEHLVLSKLATNKEEREREIVEIIRATAIDFGVAYSEVKKMMAKMKKKASGTKKSRAIGGMITEPVIGVGLNTGDTWSFGERGMEYVTPNTALGGNQNYDQRNNVVINVSIDKVANNVDLQQIKPIVERALRESHSRRGII